MRRVAIASLVMAGAFVLAGCESRTERTIRTTDSGKTVVEKEVRVGVDPDVQAKAEEAGREIKEAGKEAARDVKEGVEEAQRHVPDVDVDVKVKPSEAEREKNPSN